MKRHHYLIILPLCTLFLFNGKTYNDAVTERIGLKVNVCLEGQDCGSSSAASTMSASSSAKLEKVMLSEGSEHIVKMLNSGDGGNMIFEPAVIKVSKGDTIHFKAVDMLHNSATIDGMLPAGAAEWASELSKDFSIALETEGVYVYQCDPHAMMAMIGVIQVGEAVNLDAIKAKADKNKSLFVMNADRIDNYLSQL
jgi:pseudoazurin